MKLRLNNEQIIEVVYDVIIRFCEHEQYGSELKAIQALSRRLDSLSITKCTKLFNFHRNLLEKTIEAIDKAPKHSTGEYVDYNDIDLIFVNKFLHKVFPKQKSEILQTYINWVIYWHYLK